MSDDAAAQADRPVIEYRGLPRRQRTLRIVEDDARP